MTDTSIISWFQSLPQWGPRLLGRPSTASPLTLRQFYLHPEQLPQWVRDSPVAQRYLALLGPLDWDHFPERSLQMVSATPPVPYAAFTAAYLVKLDQHLVSMAALRQSLVDHPMLVWLFGFPRSPSRQFAWGFDADASLPTQRHLTRMLRTMPNTVLQFLLSSSIALLQTELVAQGLKLGECISLDTKHIIAWVKENNPKVYVANRYNKAKQPAGDPDCRLGCKRRHNQTTSAKTSPPTPTTNPVPAHTLSVGEFYWGYASGVVATKIPDWGEFVLAELTQPFDCSDVSYFFPLLTATEKRLGFRPPFAALDAAFDAFYVYEYFHHDEGFAAVPFSERGGYKKRQFTPDGWPLCAAGLPMPLKYTFTARSHLMEYECGRYVCALRFPTRQGRTCPRHHPRWKKGGCITTMPTSIGARLRYQLDRTTPAYQAVFDQRTATERINSLAVELGIERPHIRNGQAVANLNTLTYVLLNLRALQRVRQHRSELRPAVSEN